MAYVRRALPPFGVTGFHLIYFPGGCFTAGIAFLSTILAGISLLGLIACLAEPDPKPEFVSLTIGFAAFPALVGLHGLIMGIAWVLRSDADWEKTMRERDRREGH